MTQENHFISPRLLDRLLATSSAAAAIILRGEKVIMKAGELSTDGFNTAESVLQNFGTSDGLQMFDHYGGFTMGQHYHLLFAKNFPQDDAILGLVFSIQTPLTQIREEMRLFMKALIACRALVSNEERSLESAPASYLEPGPLPHDELNQSGWEPEVERPIEQDEEPTVPQTLNLSTQNIDQSTIEKSKRAMSFGIEPQKSDDSTPPTPLDVMMDEIPWQPIDEQWPVEPDENQNVPSIGEESDSARVDEPSPPLLDNQYWQPLTEIPHETDDLISMLQDDFQVLIDGDDLPLYDEPDDYPENKIIEQSLEDTEPILIADDENSTSETISDTTFYLVPRLNEHYILRDLSHQLRSWMPEICEKYGWQIDSLLIRPDYLKWTLRDFPESLLREMLTIVRIETSRRIFSVFPNLLEGNPSHDFWSPGYLVDTQNQEFSTQALIARISSSRADAWGNC